VAYFLHSQGVAFHVLTLDAPGAILPPVEQPWRAIVSLGGPQGAYEEEAHPWIVAEKAFLRAHALERSPPTPVLGICLGAQMFAGAIGGRCYAAAPAAFEVGYIPLRLTEAGARDPMLARVFERAAIEAPEPDPSPEPTVSSPADPASVASAAAAAPGAETGATEAWTAAKASSRTSTGFLEHHGDTFDLPPDVPVLLQSSGFKQCFRAGSALAVQFHPEAGLHEISTWVRWKPARYPPLGTTAEALVALVAKREAIARTHARIFFEEWWRSLGNEIVTEQLDATHPASPVAAAAAAALAKAEQAKA
jgi:GMP synthase-like glutamine amidotransferase